MKYLGLPYVSFPAKTGIPIYFNLTDLSTKAFFGNLALLAMGKFQGTHENFTYHIQAKLLSVYYGLKRINFKLDFLFELTKMPVFLFITENRNQSLNLRVYKLFSGT